MADTVITALIGAGGAVLGATIPILLNAKRDRERFTDVDRSRQEAFAGDWKVLGKEIYNEHGTELWRFDMEVSFTIKSGKLTGAGKVLDSDGAGKHVPLAFEGGFFDSEYVQLSYRSKASGRKQVGVMVLRLSETGESLIGHYAGFSPLRTGFVAGSLQFTRP